MKYLQKRQQFIVAYFLVLSVVRYTQFPSRIPTKKSRSVHKNVIKWLLLWKVLNISTTTWFKHRTFRMKIEEEKKSYRIAELDKGSCIWKKWVMTFWNLESLAFFCEHPVSLNSNFLLWKCCSLTGLTLLLKFIS